MGKLSMKLEKEIEVENMDPIIKFFLANGNLLRTYCPDPARISIQAPSL